MAITIVYSDASGQPNGADVEFDFSGRGLQQNDIVLVLGGHSRTGSNAGVSTSGYTELFDLTTGPRFSASWKRMGASPDPLVTCIGSGDATDGTAYAIHVLRGVSTTTAIDATSATDIGIGSLPNSPSITTVTDGALVISGFLIKDADSSSVATKPTGYSNARYAGNSDTNAVSAGIASKIIASAGAENPGVWSLTIVSAAWESASIAFRPSTASFGDGSLSSTGTGTTTFVGATTPDITLSATGTGTATFLGNSLIESPLSITGSAAVDFIGTAFSNQPQPFSMTGTGTALFVGALAGAGGLATTGSAQVIFAGNSLLSARVALIGRGQAQWVGAVSHLSSVREDIRSRGAATITMGHNVG